MAESDGGFFFADYKGDDSYTYLRNSPRYYVYSKTLEALEMVHSRLYVRISGEDASRHPVTLVWDEYMANILALTSEDKKVAAVVMNKVSEFLLVGRSMSIRLITSMQRLDVIGFPACSRLNYGIVVVLGAVVKPIYEMLLPDFMDDVKGQPFARGEVVVLLQGSELRFLKVGMVRDV